MPQRGRDAGHLHRQGAAASSSAPAIAGEVLIADNGSTDGSQEIAASRRRARRRRRAEAATARRSPAASTRRAAATSSWAMPTTATISPISTRSSPRSATATTLVMGNRFKGGIAPGAMPWHHRYIGNPVLSFLGRLFFGTRGVATSIAACAASTARRSSGSTCAPPAWSSPPRCWSRRRSRASASPRCRRRSSPTAAAAPPHLRSFRDGWRHLRFLLLFSPRWLFLYPGLLLLAVGLFFGTLLIRGPVQHQRRRSSSTSTPSSSRAMCIIVGLQAVSFAVIGRRFASRYGFIPRSETFDALLESADARAHAARRGRPRRHRPRRARLGGIAVGERRLRPARTSPPSLRVMIVAHDRARRRAPAGDERLHVLDDRHPAERAPRRAGARRRLDAAPPHRPDSKPDARSAGSAGAGLRRHARRLRRCHRRRRRPDRHPGAAVGGLAAGRGAWHQQDAVGGRHGHRRDHLLAAAASSS